MFIRDSPKATALGTVSELNTTLMAKNTSAASSITRPTVRALTIPSGKRSWEYGKTTDSRKPMSNYDVASDMSDKDRNKI